MPSDKNLALKTQVSLPNDAPEIVKGASLWDESDPESVINLCPASTRAAIMLHKAHPDFRRIFRNGEPYIKEELKPSAQMARLRLGFWDEYTRAVDRGSQMLEDRIYAGIVSRETFQEEYYTAPEKLGYLLLVPPHYKKAAEEILLLGLERLRDIIQLPLTDAKGRVQSSVITGVLKAVEMLDRRVKGAVLQKLAVHQHHTQGALPSLPEGSTAADELEMLNSELSKMREKAEAHKVKTVVDVDET